MAENSSVQKGIDRIKEIAEDVYRTLGSGFSEDVYDRAMQVGLRLAKIPYEGQKVVELKYKDHYVGEGYPDLVIRCGEERIIVELKAVSGDVGAVKRTATPELHENLAGALQHRHCYGSGFKGQTIMRVLQKVQRGQILLRA